MKTSIKLLLCLFVAVLLTRCNSGSAHDNFSDPFSASSSTGEESRPLTEAELKQQLLDKECSGAKTYLDGTLGFSPIYKNVLSMKVKGLKVKCNLTSKATLAVLKDIRIHVKFFSKTNAVVLGRDFTVYEFIAPGRSIRYKTEFEITNQQFKNISRLEWSIEGANCSNN